ncbi:SAM-dependent methyltransferase [Actinoplanes sp. TFC3]|uniref:SAM-dependent methyltransferase n=1 Tax=Actinoplanes sp. TFC3 TaxID=1710355 RepID=UPI00082FA43D|nr:SAM-dependent methyltransferase [Actinoplanes sp. TFC3]
MSTDPTRPPLIDTTVAHPARRYNYWLGGKDNFAADRDSGDCIEAVFPWVRSAARHNRSFLHRAVHYLAQDHDIRQYIDVGTGLPMTPNTHDVAQHVHPDARVVYVDNDPLVLVHARALLTGTPQGRTAYLDADLRQPHTILDDPDLAKTLDLSQPVALLIVATLHFVTDDTQALNAVTTLLDALAPGSFLVASHATADTLTPADRDQLAASNLDFVCRTRQQFHRFFTGMHLTPPGITCVHRWHPPPGPDAYTAPSPGPARDIDLVPGQEPATRADLAPDSQVNNYGAVACKP